MALKILNNVQVYRLRHQSPQDATEEKCRGEAERRPIFCSGTG